MSEPNKYREWILETIDSLRSRKARPDLERICRMVRRRHGSDPDRTRTELEKLIQEQTVLKVSYKGSISYRNAAKVQRKSRKKTEFTAAGTSSSTKHDLNNTGDSAHSFTDQEEDCEPSPHPHTPPAASTTSPHPPAASTTSPHPHTHTAASTTSPHPHTHTAASTTSPHPHTHTAACTTDTSPRPSAASITTTDTSPHPSAASTTTTDTSPHPSAACTTDTSPHPPAASSTTDTSPHPPAACTTSPHPPAASSTTDTSPHPSAACTTTTDTSPHPSAASTTSPHPPAACTTSPHPHTHTAACTTDTRLQSASCSQRSGNVSLSCGATTGSAVGSGCKEEKTSAPRDKGLHHGGGGGQQPGLSGADTHRTCPGSVSSSLPPQRQKQAAPFQHKLGAGSHVNKSALVSPVRSLSRRSLRGAANTRGHTKEILGCLSSQERLSEEKLTRGKVKVVMEMEKEKEKEVARGRLRRTRCGNMTLPLIGMMVEEPVLKNVSAGRLVKISLQDQHPVKKENEPMEAASEEERGENEEEEEEDPKSSDGEGGLSPVTMTTEPGLIEKTTEDAEIQTTSKQESPHQQQDGGKGMDSLTRTLCPPVYGASLSQCIIAHPEERPVTTDHLHLEAQDQMQSGRINHTSAGFNSLECKTEAGVSSCMLTPTASPRDSGLSEEQGMNGGLSSEGFMKSEGASGSPVDWTVSDVVSYFTAAGFPEQAAAFRTQEIDGKSLLLMQRNDVLTGLSIRLGPALKIYERHVKVLQKTHFEDDDC